MSICALGGVMVLASCGDDEDFSVGDGGEWNAGRGGSGTQAGTGGRNQAGKGGSTGGDGQGGIVSKGGAPSGGRGGSPTEPGSDAGAGGDPAVNAGGAGGDPAVNAGGAGGDPAVNAGGAGGESSVEPTLVFDFEDGAQGFTTDGANVTVAASTTRAVSGSQSLQVTLPSMTDDNRLVFVDGAAFWPGTVIELNVWVPEGDDDLYVQAFSLIDFYQWDATSSLAAPLVRGGWTKWTYTVPRTFPGGMQRLGIQFGSGARTFAGGDVYVDAIATLDGAAEACSGDIVTKPTSTPGRREFDFESASPEWEVDGQPADVALSLSGDEVLSGTSALKVTLTAIPAGGTRKIRVPGPETFCGDTVTFNVWTPEGSDGLNLQAYVQYNNWVGWFGIIPEMIDRGDYTEITLPVPGLESTPPVGPGGYQALGIEIANETGAPFTGDVYVDDVIW